MIAMREKQMKAFNNSCRFCLTLVVGTAGFCSLTAYGQSSTSTAQPAVADSEREAARQQVLQSDRWRRARHGMNEWLSIQRLYSREEVALLQQQFQQRIDRMSADELQDQLLNMEEKLAVLSSPEAEEARTWLSQFLAVQAKYTDEQLRARRPDIANMTASQIRRELDKFQQRRGTAQRTQAAAQQGRAMQLQNAQSIQAQRQQGSEQARQSATRAAVANQAARTVTQTRTDLPGHSLPPVEVRPAYTVGPWGNPIRWDPLAGFW
jgi:hypothetical protein